jgi:hypothetical protein
VISEIRLRYFDGCPNWTTAEARVREAIRSSDSGDRTRIVLERVETDDEAQRLGFLGSPTILLDGVDPFSVEQLSFGLTCRLYKTEAGFEGSPSVDQLRKALQDSLVGRPSDLRGGLPLGTPCEDCDEVAAEAQRDSRTVRTVRNAAFRLLLATGAPVSLAEIASRTGVPEGEVGDAVRALEARGRTQRDSLDRVLTCGGLSVEPTRHRIEVGDMARWTMCAYDALGVLGALGRSGRVVSRSPLDETEIVIQFADGSPTASDSVLFFASGYEACGSVYDEWCPLVNLFPSRVDAERWAQADEVSGHILTLADATKSAIEEWRPLVAG